MPANQTPDNLNRVTLNAPRVTHLTMTGYYAGMVICGAKKDPTTADYKHAIYYDFSAPYAVNVCQACKAEFDAAQADDVNGGGANA